MANLIKSANGLLFYDDFSEKTLMWTLTPSYAATALEFEQLHLMEDAVLMCQDYAISQRSINTDNFKIPNASDVGITDEHRYGHRLAQCTTNSQDIR